ncbi:MAG: hypothetical protein QXU87_04025 [Candidatus Caldarchaeum sp.]
MKTILLGLVGGALYGLTGYIKSGEPFDRMKFAKTVALAAVIGAANSVAGLPVTEEAVLTLLSAGEVAVIENLLKALRHVR